MHKYRSCLRGLCFRLDEHLLVAKQQMLLYSIVYRPQSLTLRTVFGVNCERY